MYFFVFITFSGFGLSQHINFDLETDTFHNLHFIIKTQSSKLWNFLDLGAFKNELKYVLKGGQVCSHFSTSLKCTAFL